MASSAASTSKHPNLTISTSPLHSSSSASCSPPTSFESVSSLASSHSGSFSSIRSQLPSPLDSTIDDVLIYRFLKGWNFDESKAVEQMKAMILWRKDNGLNVDFRFEAAKAPQTEFPHYEKIVRFYPHNIIHHTDKLGQPLSIERLGLSNPTALCKSVTLEQFCEYHIWHMENKAALVAAATAATGTVVRLCKITDLSGLGRQHLSRRGLKYLQHLIHISQDFYPEMLGSLYLINTPWIFHTAWKLVKPWLREATLSKIHILGSDYRQVLLQHIDADSLPKFLGGNCECALRGGCVPTVNPNQGMKKAQINARAKHEEKIEVSKEEIAAASGVEGGNGAGSLFVSIEFRTENHDIGFEVKFIPSSAGSAGGERELLSAKRYDCHSEIVHQSVPIPEAGTVLLMWDNGYSRFTGKTLWYRIEMERKEGGDELSLSELEACTNGNPLSPTK